MRSALAGARVVVTRPAGSAESLRAGLAAAGASVRHYPLTRTLPPADPAAVGAALRGLADYAWLVFTSATAVRAFQGGLAALGGRLPVGGPRVAAVGPATAEALADHAIAVDVVPDDFLGVALPAAMEAVAPLAGARVLLPRSALGAAELPEALRERGAQVDDVAFYDTGRDEDGAGALSRALNRGEVDVLTFAAPSAVDALRWARPSVPETVGVVVIGPTTGAAVRRAGWPVDAVAEEHTVAGLVRAVVGYWAGRAGS